VAEDVLLVADVVGRGRARPACASGGSRRPGLVGHRERHAEFGRVLPRRGGAVVDRDQRGDVGQQDRGGAVADLLGDGEQPEDVDGRVRPLSTSAFSAASITATPALLSRWRETMKPLSRNSGCGSMATMSPTSIPSGAGRPQVEGEGVDAQLDMVPADGLGVDLVVVGVARGLERQDGAAIGALLGEERARAPSAKRADQVPIGTSSSRPLASACLTCAPSVSRCETMARAPRRARAGHPGADRAAPGQVVLDAQRGRARRRHGARWCRCSRSGWGSRAALELSRR
jgi:hypothetical protein